MKRKYEVCPTCRGEGKHVNRAVDGNGITGAEMAELGPEFVEDYMGGLYDVRCETCHGKRVVTAEDVVAFDEAEEDRRIRAAESGYFAGRW